MLEMEFNTFKTTDVTCELKMSEMLLNKVQHATAEIPSCVLLYFIHSQENL